MTAVAPGFRLQVATGTLYGSDKHCTLSDASVADLMILATDGPGGQSILAGFATSGLNPCPSVLRIDAPSPSAPASVSLAGDLFCRGFSNVQGVTYVSTISGTALSNCSLDACSIPATWMSNIVRQCVLPPFLTVSSNCLGVGVSNPKYTLDIQGDIRATGNLVTKGVKMYRSAPAPDYSTWATDHGLLHAGSSPWKQLSNTAATYVTSSNVGVGTSSPAFPLDVVGTARFDDIVINGGITSHGMDIDLAWMSNAAGWASNAGSSSASQVVQYSSLAGAPWALTPAGDAVLSARHVGIGTPSPQYTMDVKGMVRASGGFTAFSDARYKTDIRTIPDALGKVLQLTGYSFCMRDDGTTARRQVGLLAQDVLAHIPEVVHGDDDTGLSVAYGNMVAVLIEAMKTLEARISALERPPGGPCRA